MIIKILYDNKNVVPFMRFEMLKVFKKGDSQFAILLISL